MFHKAVDLSFGDGTVMEVTFQSGEIKQYDMANLFEKYPILEALKERDFFVSGKLAGSYGIVWNDEIDVDVETVYEDGETIGIKKLSANVCAGYAVSMARETSGLSQKELAERTGIDQSDISKIERGVANPSVNTLNRIADALGGNLRISIEL